MGNNLGISYKWYGFELEGQRWTLGLGLTATRRGFELYECLLVWDCVTLIISQSHLITSERPRAELHVAFLLIERKVSNVDRTGTFIDGWGNPQHVTGIIDDDVWLVRHLVIAIGAIHDTVSIATHTLWTGKPMKQYHVVGPSGDGKDMRSCQS